MQNHTNKVGRKKRVRTRKNGRLTISKRPDAKRNGAPHRVFIETGWRSYQLKKGVQDKRSAFYKTTQAHAHSYLVHLGGPGAASEVELRLAEQAAQKRVLAQIALAAVQVAGLVRDGAITPELEAFLRLSREEREVLRLLGLRPRAKKVPTLDEYLRSKDAEQAIPAPSAEKPLDKESATDAP